MPERHSKFPFELTAIVPLLRFLLFLPACLPACRQYLLG
jgi:hypothetical protein